MWCDERVEKERWTAVTHIEVAERQSVARVEVALLRIYLQFVSFWTSSSTIPSSHLMATSHSHVHLSWFLFLFFLFSANQQHVCCVSGVCVYVLLKEGLFGLMGWDKKREAWKPKQWTVKHDDPIIACIHVPSCSYSFLRLMAGAAAAVTTDKGLISHRDEHHDTTTTTPRLWLSCYLYMCLSMKIVVTLECVVCICASCETHASSPPYSALSSSSVTSPYRSSSRSWFAWFPERSWRREEDDMWRQPSWLQHQNTFHILDLSLHEVHTFERRSSMIKCYPEE